VTIAHLAGIPFEEWISPLLVCSSGGILFVLRGCLTWKK
jgi:hypothetical protein